MVQRPSADAHSVDLLPLAFLRSPERYSFLCHYGRYNPDRLSSEYFDLCLPLSRTLICHNFEALDAFFNRAHTFIFVPALGREFLSPVDIFLDVLMPVLG